MCPRVFTADKNDYSSVTSLMRNKNARITLNLNSAKTYSINFLPFLNKMKISHREIYTKKIRVTYRPIFLYSASRVFVSLELIRTNDNSLVTTLMRNNDARALPTCSVKSYKGIGVRLVCSFIPETWRVAWERRLKFSFPRHWWPFVLGGNCEKPQNYHVLVQ